jgi:hypothetical protein
MFQMITRPRRRRQPLPICHAGSGSPYNQFDARSHSCRAGGAGRGNGGWFFEEGDFMARFQPGPFGAFGRTGPLDYESSVDSVTLGQFFNAVYAWMAVGLALTGFVAYAVAGGLLPIPMTLGTVIVLFIAQIALVMAIGNPTRLGASVATVLFLLYAAITGVMLSVLFMVYTRTSLASTFLVTGGMFSPASAASCLPP